MDTSFDRSGSAHDVAAQDDTSTEVRNAVAPRQNSQSPSRDSSPQQQTGTRAASPQSPETTASFEALEIAVPDAAAGAAVAVPAASHDEQDPARTLFDDGPAGPADSTSCLDDERALFCLSLNNPFRGFFIAIVQSKAFFVTVLVAIALNSIVLAVPQPRYQLPDWLVLTLQVLEFVFTAFFALEMVIKIIALGLVLHPGAYLRAPWNVFDGTVTIVAIVAISSDLSNVTALRAWRILRALRAVSHVRQLRALVSTLFTALRPVLTSLLVILWFMFFFATLTLHRCGDGAMSRRCYDVDNSTGDWVLDPAHAGCGGFIACDEGQICAVNRTVYDASPLTFDHIGESFLVIVKLVTIDNWNVEMDKAVSSCGVEMIGVMIVVTLVGGFVMMNVFLAILMTEYTKAMNEMEAEAEAELAMERAGAFDPEDESEIAAGFTAFAEDGDDDDEGETPEATSRHASSIRRKASGPLDGVTPIDVSSDHGSNNSDTELTEVKAFLTPTRRSPNSSEQGKLDTTTGGGGALVATNSDRWASPKANLPRTTSLSASKYLSSTPKGGGVSNDSLAFARSVRFADPPRVQASDPPQSTKNALKKAPSSSMFRTQSSALFKAIGHLHDELDQVSSEDDDDDKPVPLKPVRTVKEFDELDKNSPPNSNTAAGAYRHSSLAPTNSSFGFNAALGRHASGRVARRRSTVLALAATESIRVSKLQGKNAKSSGVLSPKLGPNPNGSMVMPPPLLVANGSMVMSNDGQSTLSPGDRQVTPSDREGMTPAEADSTIYLQSTSNHGGGSSEVERESARLLSSTQGSALGGTALFLSTGNDPFGAGADDDEDDESVSACRLKFRDAVDRLGYGMLVVTLVNVVVLAMDHYGIDHETATILDLISLICTILFAVELLIKVIAYGPVRTFRDGFNVFDLFLVLASVVEYVMLSTTTLSALRAIRILRLLRAFKVLRVTRRAAGLRILIAALQPSVVPALFVLALLLIVVFAYSVLGMQFFGYTDFTPFRVKYDTIWEAALSNFIIITGDNWSDVMVLAMRTNVAIAVLFFLSLFFFGNYIVVNLFGAVIVDHLERAAQAEWDDATFQQSMAVFNEQTPLQPPRLFLPDIHDLEPELKNDSQPMAASTSLKLDSPKSNSTQRAKLYTKSRQELDGHLLFYQDHNPAAVRAVLLGHSFFIFSPSNCVRRGAAALVFSMPWRCLSVLVTVANLAVIALYSPLSSSSVDDYDFELNVAFLSFFGFEIFLEMFARGVFSPILNIPRFEDGGHVGGLSERGDAMAESWIAQPGSLLNVVIVGLGIGSFFFQPLRAFDSLRALKISVAVPPLRMLLLSLVQTLPNIAQAAILSFIFWTIFAIFGVQLFMGTYYDCTDPRIHYEVQCVGLSNETLLLPDDGGPAAILSAEELEAITVHNTNASLIFSPDEAWLSDRYNTTLRVLFPTSEHNGHVMRKWSRFNTNFDDFIEAMFSLFVVAIGEQWTDVMYAGIDSTDVGEGPIEDYRQYVSLYFVAFIFIGRFLTLNIMIGVLITFFLYGKRRNDGTTLLTPDERAYILTKRVLDSTMFDHDPAPPKNCIRLALFRFLTTTIAQVAESCQPKDASGRRKIKHRGFGTHVVVHETPIFEIFASLLVLAYTVVLMLHGLELGVEDYTDYFFTGIVCFIAADMLAKCVAFSVVDYVMLVDGRRDLVILLVVGAATAFPQYQVYGRLIILLRTTRLLSYIMVSDNAQKLFALIIHSLPTLATVIATLAIMFFVFAGVGVRLFAEAPIVEPFDGLTNFQTMSHAAVTLYQVLTTEGWLGIANACSKANPECSTCQRYYAYPFFVFFVAAAFIVFLQLCAVVVVEYFEELDDCADRRVVACFGDVKTQWQNVGRSTSRGLTVEKLLKLLKCTPRRLTGLPVGAGPRELFQLVCELQIPLSSDLKIHYKPFIHALVLHAFKIKLATVRNYATKMHSEVFDPRCFSAGHLLAARIIAVKWQEYIARRHGIDPMSF
jgi:hypothetical protein